MRRDSGFGFLIGDSIRIEERSVPPVVIVYEIDGESVLRVRGRTYRLGQEDIVLINPMEAHSLEPAGGTVCLLSVDYRLIAEFFPATGAAFSLNTLEKSDRPFDEIRGIFRELVWHELSEETAGDCRETAVLYSLLDILLRRCADTPGDRGESRTGRAPGRRAPAEKIRDSEKLHRIFAYVNGHFRESFSLRDLASSMYVSASSLSRFFRKQTGVYFMDYVNAVRLSRAAADLAGSGMSVTKIAAECGFPNASAFSKLFRERYGESPLAYRQRAAGEAERTDAGRKRLRKELEERRVPAAQAPGSARPSGRCAADAGKSVPVRQAFGKILNIGSMSALTHANIQFQMLYLTKELRSTYVRIWSMFAGNLQITDGKTIGVYNYSLLDPVLDLLVEHRLRPWLDFGRRPDVTLRSSDEIVYSEEVGVEFGSRRAWEALFEDFIRHVSARYGTEECREWVFDMSRDPEFNWKSRYYEDPEYDFLNVYEFAWRTVRRLIPGARVGGPVGVTNAADDGIRRFLEGAAERKCAPDFLSIILFPYDPSEDGSRFEKNPDPDYEEREFARVRGILAAAGMPELPVCCVEWNLTLSNRSVLNDSCFRGIYICRRAALFLERAGASGIWTGTDWIGSRFDTRKLLSGGGGLITRDGIRKPAFFAAQFAGRLGNRLIFHDRNCVVTGTGSRSFMILAFGSAEFHVNYYLRKEETITGDNVGQVVSCPEAVSREITLTGLPEGEVYVVKTRSVSPARGSVMDEWKRLGCEENLERSDIRYLQETCVPYMSMERTAVRGGSLKLRINLVPLEFQLIHLYPGE